MSRFGTDSGAFTLRSPMLSRTTVPAESCAALVPVIGPVIGPFTAMVPPDAIFSSPLICGSKTAPSETISTLPVQPVSPMVRWVVGVLL